MGRRSVSPRTSRRSRLRGIAPLLILALPVPADGAGPERFRLPAPLEDDGPQVEVPVFGAPAGHEGTDLSLGVMEWVAKRTWSILGLPYERKDFTGPPAMRVTPREGWIEVEGTVCDGGVPLRNGIVECEVEQIEGPLIVLIRSTDAFGEALLELDLRRGQARARSVTVSRSMIGGQSHSSPMPEQASSTAIAEAAFSPRPPGPARLRLRMLGPRIEAAVDGKEVLAFDDPDGYRPYPGRVPFPALTHREGSGEGGSGGKFGIGSAGRMRVRDVRQWELVSPREKARREACIADMEAFVRKVDLYHDDDVRARNRVEIREGRVFWKWPATGATASFRVEGPRVLATVRSGLYGAPVLADGPFPEVGVVDERGEEYRPDPGGTAAIEGSPLSLRMVLPLRSPAGKSAAARVTVRLTVQTVWFWTVEVEGARPARIEAGIFLAPPFALDSKALAGPPDRPGGIVPLPAKDVLRHDGRAGLYLKAIDPDPSPSMKGEERYPTVLGARDGRPDILAVAGSDPRLRFATSILPAQPLNLTGFRHRMVHFIRYPEGPVEGWRRLPSPQEYPTDVDLLRYRSNGTDALVLHHTWIGSDFRDREGFLVNPPEMSRAMETTHRLGMKAIGYLGIVPGRSSLLRFEDLGAQGRPGAWGGYEKNWDLQDATFYHVAGRYPGFIAWMADFWCKEYGLDGFYLDGGAFGTPTRGPLAGRGGPEDGALSVDELVHRAYWRVRKVLELNGARYGLEPWSGLDWLLVGFYDCMMIGESFQEAPPEYYRDGNNALLTGCAVKMYGMRESSQNPYNIAMAAVNLSDIQVCSGNGAWGDDPDTADTWARVRPLWDLLDSIDWDRLVEARPWYAQDLVRGEGFFAAHYTEPRRALVFLANRSEAPGRFEVRIDRGRLPAVEGEWRARYCLGRTGDIGPLCDGRLTVDLPALHGGPIGIELIAGTSGGGGAAGGGGAPPPPPPPPPRPRARSSSTSAGPSREIRRSPSTG